MAAVGCLQMSVPVYLGIEIGGTKLQLGVGPADGSPLWALERTAVDPRHGARGILEQIAALGNELVARFPVRAVGIGFGGPLDATTGRTLKSHHVAGWDDFPLVAWCRERWGLPTALANDADTAGLAEAHWGAGRGASPVWYLTVGTGIGAGLILDGKIYAGCGAGAAELGHLRPGLAAVEPEQNLESLAAGWGIAARARQALAAAGDESLGPLEQLTTAAVARAARAAHPLARRVWDEALQALGWGIAQAITLVSPRVVVVGGGVSLAGEELFFAPLRRAVERYVFPPFRGTYQLVPAALGEEVVIHGALRLAAEVS